MVRGWKVDVVEELALEFHPISLRGKEREKERNKLQIEREQKVGDEIGLVFFPLRMMQENPDEHTFRRTVLFVVSTMSLWVKGALSLRSRMARVISRELSRHFLSDSSRLLPPLVPIWQMIFAEEIAGSDSRSSRRVVTSRLFASFSGKLRSSPMEKDHAESEIQNLLQFVLLT